MIYSAKKYESYHVLEGECYQVAWICDDVVEYLCIIDEFKVHIRRKCTSTTYPHKSLVKFSMHTGMRSSLNILCLKNKPKNMNFGEELNEIQSIL